MGSDTGGSVMGGDKSNKRQESKQCRSVTRSLTISKY